MSQLAIQELLLFKVQGQYVSTVVLLLCLPPLLSNSPCYETAKVWC